MVDIYTVVKNIATGEWFIDHAYALGNCDQDGNSWFTDEVIRWGNLELHESRPTLFEAEEALKKHKAA